MSMYYDTDGRPRMSVNICPECGYEHGYVWGHAPRGKMLPNGGCPHCKHLWRFSDGAAIEPKEGGVG